MSIVDGCVLLVCSGADPRTRCPLLCVWAAARWPSLWRSWRSEGDLGSPHRVSDGSPLGREFAGAPVAAAYLPSPAARHCRRAARTLTADDGERCTGRGGRRVRSWVLSRRRACRRRQVYLLTGQTNSAG